MKMKDPFITFVLLRNEIILLQKKTLFFIKIKYSCIEYQPFASN